MNMLYDSESFSVLHLLAGPVADVDTDAHAVPMQDEPAEPVVALPTLARHGFEIVDKRSGKEVYLDGSWAELFQRHISAWRLKQPTQEEVEATLDQYAELAQNPVVMH